MKYKLFYLGYKFIPPTITEKDFYTLKNYITIKPNADIAPRSKNLFLQDNKCNFLFYIIPIVSFLILCILEESAIKNFYYSFVLYFFLISLIFCIFLTLQLYNSISSYNNYEYLRKKFFKDLKNIVFISRNYYEFLIRLDRISKY